MKERNGRLIVGTLLLLTAILSTLKIDFSNYDWLDVMPAILFGIAGIMSIRNAFKKKEMDE